MPDYVGCLSLLFWNMSLEGKLKKKDAIVVVFMRLTQCFLILGHVVPLGGVVA